MVHILVHIFNWNHIIPVLSSIVWLIKDGKLYSVEHALSCRYEIHFRVCFNFKDSIYFVLFHLNSINFFPHNFRIRKPATIRLSSRKCYASNHYNIVYLIFSYCFSLLFSCLSVRKIPIHFMLETDIPVGTYSHVI